MAGLMSRVALIARAKANTLVDAAEGGAVTDTIDLSYEDMQTKLVAFRRGIVEVATAKKQIEATVNGKQADLTRLEAQARQALAAGREDLAKLALTRKSAVEAELTGLTQQLEAMELKQQQLSEQLKAYEAKLEAFRSQKEVMKAQFRAAEAQVAITAAVTGVGEHMNDMGLALQRAKDRTDQMVARAGALDELTASGALTDMTSDQTDLDRQLAQLSTGSQVDSELEKLKMELASGSQPAAALGVAK